MRDTLEALTKAQLAEVKRSLCGTVGDLARTSKLELVEDVVAFEPAALQRAVESVVLSQGKTSLIAGALSSRSAAPVIALPTAAAAPVVQPIPDVRVIATESAEKAFGVRSKFLRDMDVEVCNDPDAPKVKAGYKFKPERLASVLSAIKRGRPVWLGGPAGTGKTEFVRQLCARLGRAFVRVQFDASLEAYHVIGGERVKGATTYWQDGLVLQGFRRPYAVILLDEVGFARREYTSSLHAALESEGVVTIPETGEVVRRAPGVCFMAADNSMGRGDTIGTYGVREQGEAFLDRFGRFIEFTYLPVEEEVEVVVNETAAPASLAKLVVEFLGVCRLKAEGGMLDSPPSMRQAMYLAEALADGVPPRVAFEESIVNRAPSETRETMQQLWAANVDEGMIEDARNGNTVTLKGAKA